MNLYETDIVIKTQAELKAINPNLTVQSVGGTEDRISSIDTSFVLKGNKDIYNSLLALGWLPTQRFKVITNGSRYQSKGYEMRQGMAKYFR